MARNPIRTAAVLLCAAAVLGTTAAAGNAVSREGSYGYPTTNERGIAAASSSFYKEIAWLH